MKPLNQIKANLAGMVLGWSPFKMAAVTKNRNFFSCQFPPSFFSIKSSTQVSIESMPYRSYCPCIVYQCKGGELSMRGKLQYILRFPP